MHQHFHSKQSLRWILLSILLVTILFGFSGYRYYIFEQTKFKEDKSRELSAIADLKLKQIVSWRKERLSDITYLFNLSGVSAQIQQLQNRSTHAAAQKQMVQWLHPMYKNQHYESMHVFNAEGQDLLRLPDSSSIQREVLKSDFDRAHKNRYPVFSDFIRDSSGHIMLNVIAPVFSSDSINQGFVVLCIDPYAELYPLLQSWPVPSTTSEVLIVERNGDDVLYLNDLRHRNNTAMSMRLPVSDEHLTAAMAVQGREGIVEGKDYRQIATLAAIRKIEDTPWFLIAKIDTDEVYQDLIGHAVSIAIIILLVIVTAGLSGRVIWARIEIDHQRSLLTAELERQALVKHFDYLLIYANDMILLSDKEGKIIELNDRVCQTYGYTREELLQMNVHDLIPKENQRESERRFEKLAEQMNFLFESTHCRKDGSVFPVEVSSRLFEIEGKQFTQSIIRNITDRKRSEEALRESEAKSRFFSDILELSSQPFAVGYPDGRIGQFNNAFLQLVGYTKEELQSQDWANTLTPPEWMEFEKAQLIELNRTDIPVRYEKEYIRKDGTRIPVELLVHIRRDKNGKPEYYYAFVTDITDRKRAEDIIRESNERYRQLVDVLPLSVAVHVDGKLVYTNPSGVMLLGAESSKQIIGRSVNDIVHPKNVQQAVERIQRMLAGEQGLYPVEDCYIRLDGSSVPVEVRAVRLIYQGKPAVQVVVTDITDRKKYEKNILSVNRTYAVLSSINQLIVRERDRQKLFEEACRIVVDESKFQMSWIGLFNEQTGTVEPVAHAGVINDYLEHMKISMVNNPEGGGPTGTALREGHSVICSDIEHDESMRPWRAKALALGYRSFAAIPLYVFHKTIGTMSFYSSEPHFFSDDEIQLLEKLATDISFALESLEIEERRKYAEDSLKESNRKINTIVNNLRGVVYQCANDPEWTMQYISDGIYELSGYSAEEFVGSRTRSFNSIIEPSDRAIVWDIVQSALANREPYTFEYRIRAANGDQKWVWERGKGVFENNTLVTLEGFISDITERKRAEEAVQESEEKFRMVFDNVFDGICIYSEDPDPYKRRLFECNERYATMAGRSRDELLQLGSTQELQSTLEDTTNINRLESLAKRTAYRGSFSWIRPDGKANFVEYVGVPITWQGKPYSIGIDRDITERMLLEEQLRQLQKLDGLGTLAGGIAHDFNNILGIILAYITTIKMFKDDTQKLDLATDTIIKAVQRGKTLVQQILTFARKTDTAFGAVDVNGIVMEIMTMIFETFPKILTYSQNFDKAIPYINADHSQLHQALLNLCVNARDAMPKGGTLTVNTRLVSAENLRNQFPDASASSYVRVEVSDTGEGMTEEIRKRIFEPFFTTKGIGKGTGLGLAVVFGIIQTHKGFINVESEYGNGTTFHLYLPVSKEALPISVKDEEKLEEIPGGTETLLVVEDEEMLMMSLQMVLIEKGYKVLTAGDGVTALKIYQERRNDIALVLTDLGLPNMSGLEMCQRIKKINPNEHLILATGFLDPDSKLEFLKSGIEHFLYKPYDLTKVLKEIREVLNEE
jgi:PAS domain S-box-containing protein